MSFLLDTDVCSAYLKNDPRAVSKVMLHFGGLHVSVITIGELLTWACSTHCTWPLRSGQRRIASVPAMIDS